MVDLAFDVWTEPQEILGRIATFLSPLSMEGFLDGPVDAHFHDLIADAFDDEGGRGGPWEPLEAVTIEIRTSQGYPPGPINDRSGDMKAWLEGGGQFTFRNGNPSLNVVDESAGTGLRREKLKVAQQGKKPGMRGETPPRPVLDYDESDVVVVSELLVEWFLFQMSL